MFGHRDGSNDKFIDLVTDVLSNSGIDDVDIPHILACVLYKYDIKRDHLYYDWLSDHYFTSYIPEIIKNMNIIQEYLIRNGHTVKNRGGHGSGDSYVYYIPSDNRIIQCYEDQNINFICFYEKSSYHETFHIRRFWNRAGNSKYKYKRKPTVGMFRKIFKKSSVEGEYPLIYGDGRDPGYILSYNSFYKRVDASAYSQGLIRHAIFNIGSQATYFEKG